LLEIRELSVFYGGIHALKEVSLTVPEKQIITLIGANGAGKSTVLQAICGLVKCRHGIISFKGREIQHVASHRIVESGIVMVPEGRRVFVNLSVRENILMGAYVENDRKIVQKRVEWIFQLFPRLKERAKQKAGTLSGGEQQMLALGRGLMSGPELLMLDEPSLGLAPKLVKEVFGIIRNVHAEGTTVLLIEQNAKAALELASYGYVLQTGLIIKEGSGADLLKDPVVKEAYLGQSVK
jgi:branched-chain amino acid transport system ATP-binding protein